MVAAARDFVCIRPATYESEAEAAVLEALFGGRSGVLENTVFTLLAPDGVTKLTRAGRGPAMVFDDAAAMAQKMESIALRYTAQKTERAPLLPYTLDVRRGLNVAACDSLPLAVVAGLDPSELAGLHAKLSAAAWSAPVAGNMRWATANLSQLDAVEGAERGLLLVAPDPFGTSGRVVAHLSLDASADQLTRGLREALALYRPAEKDARTHVRAGQRAGIEWESEVPISDPRARE